MSDNSSGNFLAGIILPPVLFCGAILALWDNEGRFNYHTAAKNTQQISRPASAPESTTISYTATLNREIPIRDDYIKAMYGYFVIHRYAEIYSWKRCGKRRRNWCKDWYPRLEDNDRNRGLVQTLNSAVSYPSHYELGDLHIDRKNLHFADAVEAIPLSDLTLRRGEGGKKLYRYEDNFHLSKRNAEGFGDERLRYEGIRSEPRATFFGLIQNERAGLKQFPIEKSYLQLLDILPAIDISAMIKNDGVIYHLVNGDRDQGLSTINSHLRNLMWQVRFIGTGIICLAFFWFFSVFTSFLYQIPLVGYAVQFGVFVASLALGITIGIAVILSSMIFHHPFLVGIPMLAAIFAVVKLRKHRATSKANVEKTLARAREKLLIRSSSAAPATTDGGEYASPAESEFINLVKLALSDGVLDKKEKSFFIRWGKANGVSKDRMIELFRYAKKDTNAIEASSKNSLVVLICLAMSDGIMSKNEIFILQRIGTRIGLAVDEVRALIQGVENGTIAQTL